MIERQIDRGWRKRLLLTCAVLLLLANSGVIAGQGTGWDADIGAAIYSLSLSADGGVQVVGSRNDRAAAYDANGLLLWEFSAESTVWAVDTNADGSRTAVASEDRNVYLLDATGNVLWTFHTPNTFRDAAISDDGAYVAASDDKRNIYFLDGATGDVLWQEALRDVADALAISQDASAAPSLLVGSRDAYLTLYDLSGQVKWQTRFNNEVADASISRDGSRIATAMLGGTIALVNGSDGTTLWEQPPPSPIRCTNRDRNFCLHVAMSADGSEMVVGTLDGDVYLMSADDAKVTQQHHLDNSITAVALSGAGEALVYGNRDGALSSLHSETAGIAFAEQQQTQRLIGLGAAAIAVASVGGAALWMNQTAAGKHFWRVRAARPRRFVVAIWRSRISYFMIFPTLVLLMIFNYYPVGSGFYHAFTHWEPGISTRWVGAQNFETMIYSPYFFIGVKNAITLAAAAFLKLMIPLLIAELIFHIRNSFARYSIRTLFVIPLVLPTVVTILLWVNIYDPNIGLLNQTLHSLDLDHLTRSWFGDRDTALPAIIAIGFPWVSPFALLIFYGGLVAIPDELFDAAKVDGATPWTRFVRIDFPMLMGQLKLLLVLAFIGSMQEFQSILLTTGGGPGNVTYTPSLELYYQATRFSNFGLASAMGMALFLVILGGTILNLVAVRTQTEYQP